MNNIIQWAMGLFAKNPAIANNPRNAEMFKAIQNGDAKAGEEIAENLCKTYGVSKEEAITQAKQFFGF